VEEALSELDFSGLSREQRATDGGARPGIRRSLFQVALEQGRLDELREQLGQFADALDQQRELARVLLLPLLLHGREDRSLRGLLDGADEILINFLSLLIEKPPHAGHLSHPPGVRAPLGA